MTPKIRAKSAVEPEEINCLEPFTIYRLPRSSALVRRLDASEPACGSVRQKQPRISPRAAGRRNLSFCSFDPNWLIGPQTTEFCNPTRRPQAPSAAEISSITSASETLSAPIPPHSSEIVIPKKPSSPSFTAMSVGNSAVLSISAARGAISLCANSRAESLISIWSSLNSIVQYSLV